MPPDRDGLLLFGEQIPLQMMWFNVLNRQERRKLHARKFTSQSRSRKIPFSGWHRLCPGRRVRWRPYSWLTCCPGSTPHE